jgi:two-component system CheB/CheR fusion protein
MEILLKRRDGAYRWHISRAVAIRNDDGEIASWVGTATDIHEQKMFSEELERKVKERTQLLKESNINLEHSNKNLEQFAFIASHDLQEPLRKIKTFSNRLADNFSKQLPPEGQKLINKIHASSERMSVLIQDVLNFSRIDDLKNVFIKSNINDILHNVLVDFSLLITEKGAVIKRENLPVIEVIPFQINQLFYNLISNSLKFSRPDVQPVIRITARVMLAEEVRVYTMLNQGLSYCEILFEDNGIGFDEKYKEKVFQIFQRLHTTQQFPGTGIGLALCKKIALNHNGEIFARARENIGAAFQIILPLTQVLAPHATPVDNI